MKIKAHIAPVFSTGIINRIWIVINAMLHQSDVNHITGDIHFIAPFLKKNKTILTIHDCGQLKIKSGLAFKIMKYFWFTLPAKSVKWITVNSEYTRQDLLSYVNINPDKIKVIPIFVSDVFKKSPKPFNKEKPIIFQLGTAHNKNIERTIKALVGISCHFMILGHSTSEIQNLLKTNKIGYTFIDKAVTTEELFELYKKSDIISFVSTLEGFGMPIVEANIIGRPVITSDITSMPWVAGDAACLVDPFNVDQIKTGILKIIENDAYRKAIVENGYINANRFDKKNIATTYFELYRSIAS